MTYFACAAGIGVWTISRVLLLFSAPFLAASSAASFLSVPICALTQATVHFFVCRAMFSRASAVLSAIFDLKIYTKKVEIFFQPNKIPKCSPNCMRRCRAL